jgi:hypothetical protein
MFNQKGNILKNGILCLLMLLSKWATAHPMPNTIINLKIEKTQMSMTLKMPLSDFQIAYAHSSNGFIEITADKLQAYFQQHLKAKSMDSTVWKQQLLNFEITETRDSMVGNYQELMVNLMLSPSNIADLQQFNLQYDAIIHQIPNHEALIFLDENDNPKASPIGVIKLDIPTGTIPSLPICIKSRTSNFFTFFKENQLFYSVAAVVVLTFTSFILFYLKTSYKCE